MKDGNPYPNRPYPVGQLEYPLAPERLAKIADLSRLAMLEFGEQEVMFDMPRIVGMDGAYFNLGHALGGSAILLARGMEDQNTIGAVLSVDTFTYFKNQWEQAISELDRLKLSDRVVLYRGTTTEWARTFGKNKQRAAFVFIDADHSYEGVYEDWLNYAPLVQMGGVIAFHDTNQEPSNKVITENVLPSPSWKQILHVNRIKAFRRV